LNSHYTLPDCKLHSKFNFSLLGIGLKNNQQSPRTNDSTKRVPTLQPAVGNFGSMRSCRNVNWTCVSINITIPSGKQFQLIHTYHSDII